MKTARGQHKKNTDGFAQAVRVAFAERNSTARQWALANGFPTSSVYAAIRGQRNGREADRIRRRLAKALGLGGNV